ncbi:hypothetical protein DVH24_041752 [Malus domestica]|uniref:Uncharacterized protein n=1 Tax=Malus domestica TaxID=3750 RepID=A0A498IS12_MALDO|nr:hypothetical protein DVH24_041752 [Malus domestica]
MQTGRDGTERNGTGQNEEGVKMPLDGNKEEEEGDGDIIILCSTNVEQVVPEGEAERKFTQNSSRGTARSTRFRRTKRGTERLVPLCSVPSYVPNELTNSLKPENPSLRLDELIQKRTGSSVPID